MIQLLNMARHTRHKTMRFTPMLSGMLRSPPSLSSLPRSRSSLPRSWSSLSRSRSSQGGLIFGGDTDRRFLVVVYSAPNSVRLRLSKQSNRVDKLDLHRSTCDKYAPLGAVCFVPRESCCRKLLKRCILKK